MAGVAATSARGRAEDKHVEEGLPTDRAGADEQEAIVRDALSQLGRLRAARVQFDPTWLVPVAVALAAAIGVMLISHPSALTIGLNFSAVGLVGAGSVFMSMRRELRRRSLIRQLEDRLSGHVFVPLDERHAVGPSSPTAAA
jgi:hypothetical protein